MLRIFIRPGIGAGIFSLADAFYASIAIQHNVMKIIRKKIEIKILSYGKKLLNLILRNDSNTERRLFIAIKAVMEA